MAETHNKLGACAVNFMRAVAAIPFVKAEQWLRDRLEHEVEVTDGSIPTEIYCSATAFQELTDRGKREIEIMCCCIEGSTQATGYVYVAEDGSTEVDREIKIEPMT